MTPFAYVYRFRGHRLGALCRMVGTAPRRSMSPVTIRS